MDRNFLFLAGEYEVSMKAVFARDNWSHTMTAKRLVLDDGRLHRQGLTEDIHGVVYFHDSDDQSISIHNLNTLCDTETPCWPNPERLLAMEDRHAVMKRCAQWNLVGHTVEFVEHVHEITLPYPYVVKTGQQHRGEGKHLIRNDYDAAALSWTGSATVEPFFIGESLRVLVIGDRSWGVWYDNPGSWIKNSCGASIVRVEELGPGRPHSNVALESMLSHAWATMDVFGIDVAGVDYILKPSGEYHFLEINQYPGMNVSDQVVDYARSYFNDRMSGVERAYLELCRSRTQSLTTV